MSGTTTVTLGSLAAANSTPAGAGFVIRQPSSADPTKYVFGILAPGSFGGSYSLPIAANSTLGGVKSSATIAVAGDGTASLAQNGATSGQVPQWNGTTWVPATVTSGGTSYTLPTASGSVLGGVKVGTGLTIDGSGVLSASYSYTLSAATTGALGGVMLASAAPLMNGTAAVGTGTAAALANHVHPTDTSRLGTSAIPAATGALLGGSGTAGAAVAITIGSGLSLSGGALTATGGSTTITPVLVDGSTIVASTGSPYQMLAADRFVVVNKTTGAATKILLPTSPALGVEYKIKDGKGDAGTNNITIGLASGTIEGASTFVANANSDALTLVAQSSTVWWLV